jgi:hypothetical protein
MNAANDGRYRFERCVSLRDDVDRPGAPLGTLARVPVRRSVDHMTTALAV